MLLPMEKKTSSIKISQVKNPILYQKLNPSFISVFFESFFVGLVVNLPQRANKKGTKQHKDMMGPNLICPYLRYKDF
jgi:hypothetical protein